MNTMSRSPSQPLRSTLCGRLLTPGCAVGAGAVSLAGGAWLFSTVAFGWPSHRLPALVGAFIVPMCVVIGLAVFAGAIVRWRRHRDWRLVAAALLGVAGVVLFAVSFLVAAGRGGG